MAVCWNFLETNRWKACIEYNSTFKYQSGWPCLSQGALTGGAPPRVYWLVPSLPTMHSHSHRFPFSPLSSHPVLSTFLNLLPSTLPNFPAACHSFSPFPLRASFIFFFRPRTSFFGVAPLVDIGIRLEPPLLRFLHPPVSVRPSLPRTRFVSKRRSSPIHRRRTTNFFAHLLPVPSIPVYSEFLLQRVRHIVSFELFLRRTFASLILSLFFLCFPPLFPFVHVLNRLFAL